MSETALAAARRAAREHQNHEPLVELVPYAKFLGVRLSLHEGQLRSHLPFRPGLIGNSAIQALHGGVTAAFMENAALLHLLLRLDESRVPKSVDFSIDYLLPGQALDAFADCTVSRSGLRVAQVQIRCWQKSEGLPIAIARAHFLLAAPE